MGEKKQLIHQNCCFPGVNPTNLFFFFVKLESLLHTQKFQFTIKWSNNSKKWKKLAILRRKEFGNLRLTPDDKLPNDFFSTKTALEKHSLMLNLFGFGF
jgi:hypothetical protein